VRGDASESLLAGWVEELFFSSPSSAPPRSCFMVAGLDLVGPGSDSEPAGWEGCRLLQSDVDSDGLDLRVRISTV
jgi:hypothetical protein